MTVLLPRAPMYGCVAERRYWRTISNLTDYQRAQADILGRNVEAEISGDGTPALPAG